MDEKNQFRSQLRQSLLTDLLQYYPKLSLSLQQLLLDLKEISDQPPAFMKALFSEYKISASLSHIMKEAPAQWQGQWVWSPQHLVGVDIEKQNRVSKNTLKKISSDIELEQFPPLGEPVLLWTAKEAAFKMFQQMHGPNPSHASKVTVDEWQQSPQPPSFLPTLHFHQQIELSVPHYYFRVHWGSHKGEGVVFLKDQTSTAITAFTD